MGRRRAVYSANRVALNGKNRNKKAAAKILRQKSVCDINAVLLPLCGAIERGECAALKWEILFTDFPNGVNQCSSLRRGSSLHIDIILMLQQHFVDYILEIENFLLFIKGYGNTKIFACALDRQDRDNAVSDARCGQQCKNEEYNEA